jgi:hypothetical protein
MFLIFYASEKKNYTENYSPDHEQLLPIQEGCRDSHRAHTGHPLPHQWMVPAFVNKEHSVLLQTIKYEVSLIVIQQVAHAIILTPLPLP